MARLTKSDIERKLLSGMAVTWNDGRKKAPQLLLGSPKARSLFQFLLNSTVRTPTTLPETFIRDLADAYEKGQDAAAANPALPAPAKGMVTWKLKAIDSEGFGGVNIWNGPAFHFDFDAESLLIEGPNGSGKSSLTGLSCGHLQASGPGTSSRGPLMMPYLFIGRPTKAKLGSGRRLRVIP